VPPLKKGGSEYCERGLILPVEIFATNDDDEEIVVDCSRYTKSSIDQYLRKISDKHSKIYHQYLYESDHLALIEDSSSLVGWALIFTLGFRVKVKASGPTKETIVLLNKESNKEAAEKYIEEIFVRLSVGTTKENTVIFNHLAKCPQGFQEIILNKLVEGVVSEKRLIQKDQILEAALDRRILLQGCNDDIDELRTEFIDEAYDSNVFYNVNQRITFYVPGLSEPFTCGNVSFQIAKRDAVKITCDNPASLEEFPYTRSLRKIMEKENYIVEARDPLLNDTLSPAEAINLCNTSLEQKTDYNGKPINRLGNEGQEIKNRKAILIEHRDSAFIVFLIKVAEKLFGKELPPPPAPHTDTIEGFPVVKKKKSPEIHRHTLFATKTRSERKVLDPLFNRMNRRFGVSRD
jgi:hypothetical protein